MKRFILDTGKAALHLDRKRGVFERASAEVTSRWIATSQRSPA
jgi:hypothetical protein